MSAVSRSNVGGVLRLLSTPCCGETNTTILKPLAREYIGDGQCKACNKEDATYVQILKFKNYGEDSIRVYGFCKRHAIERAEEMGFRAEDLAPAANEQPKPYVGMPAFETVGSDRYPLQVVSVSKSGHIIKLCRVPYRIVEGNILNGTAKYAYDEPTDKTPTVTATLRLDDKYRVVGGIQRIVLGSYDAYRDPHV